MPTITQDEFLLTTEDYHRMAESGILDEDDRVELIDGKIVPMSPIGSLHMTCVNRLTRLFAEHTDEKQVEVSIQNPVRLGPHQEPEPDVALFRVLNEVRLPTAEDVLLLIEVADTTLAKDRTIKLPRYAEAGIPHVWIVNLEDARLETYAAPAAGRYAEEAIYRADDDIALPHTEKTVRVGKLLP